MDDIKKALDEVFGDILKEMEQKDRKLIGKVDRALTDRMDDWAERKEKLDEEVELRQKLFLIELDKELVDRRGELKAEHKSIWAEIHKALNIDDTSEINLSVKRTTGEVFRITEDDDEEGILN